MVRKLFVILFAGGIGSILYRFFSVFESKKELGTVARHYAENGAAEIGAANLVTAVVVTYRGLDTLGEVTILFLSAAIISFFLETKEKGDVRTFRKSSELLDTASTFLVPIIFLLGVYIFINGHLTPGGGFQGGAVIASSVVLIAVTEPLRRFSHNILSFIESISGFFYVMIGLIGVVLTGANLGFLDNRALPLGELGSLISAGLIPVIYILLGLKVGTELSSIVIKLQENQEDM